MEFTVNEALQRGIAAHREGNLQDAERLFLSHLGESIAHNSRLSDWIAVDEGDYIAKAVGFASDLESLSALRRGMREQILNMPLFDAPRFARQFEEALNAISRTKLA